MAVFLEDLAGGGVRIVIQHHQQVAAAGEEAGIDRQCGAIRGDGPGDIADRLVDLAQIGVWDGIAGIQTNGVLKRLNRLVMLDVVFVEGSQAVVECGVAWLQRDSLAEAVDRGR